MPLDSSHEQTGKIGKRCKYYAHSTGKRRKRVCSLIVWQEAIHSLSISSNSFDTIVIGSGTSAYYCINALNQAGQNVAVVDERPYGGTCALRGCQPKKYLVANAEARAMAKHLDGLGLSNTPQTDWSALQELKNAFTDGISEGEVEEF